jgi:hypothetical protein
MAECMAGRIEKLPVKSEERLLRRIVVAVGFAGIQAPRPTRPRGTKDATCSPSQGFCHCKP